jgi:hypothetical protein
MNNLPMRIAGWLLDNALMWPFKCMKGHNLLVRASLLIIYVVQFFPIGLVFICFIIPGVIIEILQEEK